MERECAHDTARSQQNPPAIPLDRAKLLRAEARKMPPGIERDQLMKQARKTEIEALAERWANSPGLQLPN